MTIRQYTNLKASSLVLTGIKTHFNIFPGQHNLQT